MNASVKRWLPFPFWIVLVAAFVISTLLMLRLWIPYWYWDELDKFSWKEQGATPFVNYFLWAFLTPVVYWVYLRFKATSGGAQKVAFYLLASIIISSFHESFSYIFYFAITWLLGVDHFDMSMLPAIMGRLPGNIFARLIEFWIITSVFFAFDSYRQSQDQKLTMAMLQNQLTTAQLNTLRTRLQPHFLFNTLNTIGALVEDDPPKARKTIARLGQLLRQILDHQDRSFVTLEEELSYIRDYLDIEQTRFSDRLSIAYDIDPDLNTALVPNLLLQPLVENAIHHGIAPISKSGKITILAKRHQKQLLLEVRDNGVGTSKPEEALANPGIGLETVIERLEALYPDNHAVEVDGAAGKGFQISITLPLQFAS